VIRDQTTLFRGAVRAAGEELRFCWVQVADRDGPERGKHIEAFVTAQAGDGNGWGLRPAAVWRGALVGYFSC